MGVLSHLDPKPVFDYFEKLCAVPHGSGNTKLISDLCASFARELGLKYRQEDCNNLIIWKDASAGYENAAPVILQGHMDMVCAQTEDCTKDMSREGWICGPTAPTSGPIRPRWAATTVSPWPRRWPFWPMIPCPIPRWRWCSPSTRRPAWTAPRRWTAPI